MNCIAVLWIDSITYHEISLVGTGSPVFDSINQFDYNRIASIGHNDNDIGSKLFGVGNLGSSNQSSSSIGPKSLGIVG